MSSPTTPKPSSGSASATYIDSIVSVVDNYKHSRDNIERMFNETARFPDTSLSHVGGDSISDRENLRKKRELYQWSTAGGYPPHLKCIPRDAEVKSYDIFDAGRGLYAASVKDAPLNPEFFNAFTDGKPTLNTIEQQYIDLHKEAVAKGKEDIYTEPNVGLRDDWYTDRVFAQQHLTGVNPTGLKQASEDWLAAFAKVAEYQGNTGALQLISTYAASFYVVDNSDYRYILGIAPDAPLVSAAPADGSRGLSSYGAASVTLFTLSDSGKLHPVAICLDYKGSLDANTSVTIFNKNLTPYAPTDDELEHEDWPWRYAKMVSMTSDWLRHELVVHLTETHLVEEAIIVGAQRNLPDSHIVSKILHPHWYKTLSLNFLARLRLVPVFIERVAPLELPLIQDFVRQSYMNFDFTSRYAPTDLKNRGFDPSTLSSPKFHNYLYARNISACWDVLRTFVSSVLTAEYPGGDAQVQSDKYIAGFCAEMRSQQGGQLTSFPIVKTLDELIDMVTMCIHIASPQHTAINYLQQYYLSFVPNRPASLTTALPSTLEALNQYTEDNIIGSLPMEGIDKLEWTLMAIVPYLLSSEVDPDSNIEGYADLAQYSETKSIAEAGVAFSKNVRGLKALFDSYNKELDDQSAPYDVLHPKVIAQSILI